MQNKLTGMMVTLTAFVIIILLLASGQVSPSSAAPLRQHAPPGLFIPVEATSLDPQSVPPPLIRQQYATLDLAHLGQTGDKLTTAEANQTIQLNLFEDTTLTAALERVAPNATGGGYVWLGKIAGSPYSLVNLVVKDGLMAGDIQQPGEIYQVRPAGEGRHIIRQLDPAAMQPNLDNDAVRRPVELEGQAQFSSAPDAIGTLAADGSVIDLMVAYTAAARAQAGGTAQILLEIDSAVAFANQVFTYSKIDTQLRVVHTVEVNYTETNDRGTDLACLRNPADGCLDNLHTLRDTYFADLVSLWATYSDPYSSFGIAGLLDTLNPVTEAPYAGFSVLHVGQIFGGGYVMAHEVGHNLGANHDWYISDGTTLAGLFTANKGYVNLAQRFKTIMAYDNRCFVAGFYCASIPFFSNPNFTVNGGRIGVDRDTNTSCTAGNLNNPDCDADNHLVINNTARTVANFREPSGLAATLTAQPTPVQTTTTNINYTLTVQNTGSQDLTSLQVIDTLPGQTTFAGGVNQGGSHANGKITWSGLTLSPYASIELTFQVTIAPATLDTGDLLLNTIEATANGGVSLPTASPANIVDPLNIFLPTILSDFESTTPVTLLPCTPDSAGDSSDIADALTMCAGQPTTGQIGGSGNYVDVYKIPLAANQLMTIDLNGSGAGDVDLYLYRPEASSISSDFYIEAATTIANNDERLETTTRYGGDWYIVVYFAGGGQVDYDLMVTLASPKE